MTLSSLEQRLRQKLDAPIIESRTPQERLQHLGAFWSHWALHRRTCDATNRSIISVYRPDCPYPVWHFEHWLEHAAPPSGSEWNGHSGFFSHLWSFFQRSPIPHLSAGQSENCDYGDDVWHSRNLYLTHSAVQCQDLLYCYRVYNVRDSLFCVFCHDSELCYECVNCRNCFDLISCLSCRNCSQSAFLYDCRDCSDCLWCWNLRSKQYCIANQQLSREEYLAKRKEFNWSSRHFYQQAQSRLHQLVFDNAFHRANHLTRCEHVAGDYLEGARDCQHCFFAHDIQDCINCVRGGDGIKDAVDCLAFDLNVERVYNVVMGSENCYDLYCCFNMVRCQFMRYCAYCVGCSNCFGCCGLVNKKFYIFNQPCSEELYHIKVANLIDTLRSTGNYGAFFPGYFAPNVYDESWSGYHFPLSPDAQQMSGFRYSAPAAYPVHQAIDSSEIPDNPFSTEVDAIIGKTFWDANCGRAFRVSAEEVKLSRKLGVPIGTEFYVVRLQRNYGWIPFGDVRNVTCVSCRSTTATLLNARFDRAVLCEPCYQQRMR